ncbi:hypothetical protein F2P81_015387 [Scophthalmus maximus]|uniref:Uncharacterized protein n=1 Tax=Scophthalmus maximus TaxID=52904 RepID=A0A6A4SIM3_SCOMX|nr:hypothetical protein F2P81_015387 [Scophthalmus maximus]
MRTLRFTVHVRRPSLLSAGDRAPPRATRGPAEEDFIFLDRRRKESVHFTVRHGLKASPFSGLHIFCPSPNRLSAQCETERSCELCSQCDLISTRGHTRRHEAPVVDPPSTTSPFNSNCMKMK